ncbi:MAG: radical SAM protein [Halobacteriovoraceae bacterium]|jgi:sulfatase maturation enzyme AslB (radical SAM superfamily)|nr:radical SAM protein [Halobacteriovoraceae bacterium]MBT5093063.1 radical SAM protein [Halobacteriovoraceae bacterium]
MSLKNKFCPRPFEYLEINYPRQGKIPCYACCPSTLPVEIGDISRESSLEMWNSPALIKIRESILDGSYSYCDRDLCPEIKEDRLLDRNYLFDNFHKEIVKNHTTKMQAPKVINFANDRSCNLSCPSCRNESIMLTDGDDYQQLEAIHQQIEKELFPFLDKIILCSAGDPFASKLYRKLLLEMDGQRYPQLKIQIVSNGLLFTPEIWQKMEKIQNNIGDVYISVDASTPEVYSVVRRGGNFTDLLENLKFLAALRKKGALQHLQLDFVVQKNNYHDMPGFIKLGKELGVDRVFFQKIINWGTYTESEFLDQAIWMEQHPEHLQFKKLLSKKCFADPIVKRGNLSEFIDLSLLQKLRKLLGKVKPLRHGYIKARQLFYQQNR